MNHTEFRPALWVASLLSLLWLAVFGWLLRDRLAFATADSWLEWLTPALLPVATLFAIAAALTRGRSSDAPQIAPEPPMLSAEADFTGAVARVETVRALLAADVATLAQASRELENHASQLRNWSDTLTTDANSIVSAADRLSTQLPAAATEATRMAEAVAQSGAALSAGGEQIARIFADAGHCATQAEAQLQTASQRLLDNIATLEQQAASESGALKAEAEAAFAASLEATEAMRTAVSTQSAELADSLTQARAMLDRIGRETSAVLGQRLEAVAAQAADIEQRINAQSAAAETLAGNAERSFQLLDKRIALSADSTRARLEQLAQQVAGVNEAADAVSQPLRAGEAAVGELQAAVGNLRESVMQMIDAMGETLPARAVDASRASETIIGELRALMAEVDAASVKAHDIAAPIEASRQTIEAAAAAFTDQREAIAVAGQALVVELEQARQLIAAVEEQTQATSLAASTRLVDAMSRVREVAGQAAGTMRDTLDGVIGEARESLSLAAAEATRQSFAEPIAAQAREADALAASAAERAREASERTAASLLALAGTLKSIESRTASAEERLESLAERDLHASAALLTDRMAASSTALLEALGKPLTDEDVARWRKGERTLFGQRAVALLNRSDMAELKARLREDEEFAGLARRHVTEFEALVTRLGPDTPLGRALHQTDMGRIAMLLSDALRD